jgi:hypothetical protein
MAPKCFNKFEFVPTEGASGGIFVGWNGSFFKGGTIFKMKFAITINFASTQNADQWKLTSVYGPCHG